MLDKLLSMTIDIISHEKITAAQLASKLEISVRTVYRYLDVLSSAGIPLYCRRGNGGGIMVGREFRLPAMFLTRDELDVTLAALSAPEVKNMNSAAQARDKLATMKDRRPSEAKLYYNENYVVDNSDEGSNVSLSDKINTVISAKHNRQTMRICYHDYHGATTTRDIAPQYLVYHDGSWYVNAFCHLRGEMRLFKIARITHMTLTGGVFIPQTNSKTYSFKMKPAPGKVNLTLKVTPDGRYEAEDWLGVENVKLSDDGVNFIADGIVPADESTYSKIIAFGKNAAVLAPPAVKQAVLKMCNDFISANN